MNAIVPLGGPDATGNREATRSNQSRAESVHIVKRGDTLSGIVREHLRASGQGHSAREVYEGVERIAVTNGLKDADRIFVGQEIRLNLAERQSTESFKAVLKSAGTEKTPTTPTGMYGKVLDGPATLSSPYGHRKHPIFKDHRKHNGVDLAATHNTPITAMREGTVVFSGWQRGHGNTIVVRHANGLETQYSHASERKVSVGDTVDERTVLGLVGSTGNSTGPHLHFEVKRNGRRVNPIPYLLTNPTPRTKVSYST